MRFQSINSVNVQRYWLFFLLTIIPFSLTYIVNQTFALSYLNVFSLIFIALGVFNLLKGSIPYTKIGDKGTLYVIALLFVAMAYALFFTHPLRSGLGFWVSRLTQPFLVGFFVYQMLGAGVLKIEELVRPLLYSLALLIVGGLLQIIGVIPFTSAGRVTVLYQFPNTFARYLDILLLLLAPYLLLAKKAVWIEVAIWVGGVLLLLSTQSYNGIVSFVIGLVAILILLPRSHQKLKIRSLAMLAIVGLLVVANAPRLPKWEVSLNDSRVTRLQFWEVAGGTIKDNFWTGIGIKGWENNYANLAQEYVGDKFIYGFVSQQPHNVFLDSMLKAGPLGLIAITLVLVWPIWRGWKIYKKNSQVSWFGLSLVAYGFALFFFGFIDDPLWSDDTTPFLFIIILASGWCYSQAKLKSSKELASS